MAGITVGTQPVGNPAGGNPAGWEPSRLGTNPEVLQLQKVLLDQTGEAAQQVSMELKNLGEERTHTHTQPVFPEYKL